MGISHAVIAERLHEATVRIEGMLHIGGLDGMDVPDGLLDDFLVGFDEHTVKTLAVGLPWLKEVNLEEIAEEVFEPDDLGKAFLSAAQERGHLGFLVKVAHPFMEFIPGTTGATFSWGHYTEAWFYGEGLEEVVAAAEAWAHKIDAEERAKVEPQEDPHAPA